LVGLNIIEQLYQDKHRIGRRHLINMAIDKLAASSEHWATWLDLNSLQLAADQLDEVVLRRLVDRATSNAVVQDFVNALAQRSRGGFKKGRGGKPRNERPIP